MRQVRESDVGRFSVIDHRAFNEVEVEYGFYELLELVVSNYGLQARHEVKKALLVLEIGQVHKQYNFTIKRTS